MKEFYLVVEEFVSEKKGQILELLRKILEKEIEMLHVTWKYYQLRIRKDMLDTIADIFSELGQEKDFFVSNRIETDQKKTLWRMRRRLNRYGMYLVVRVTPQLSVRNVDKLKRNFLLTGLSLPKGNYEEYRKTYEKFRMCGVEIFLEQGELTVDEFRQWYMEWQRDENACWVSCFRDICLLVCIGIHTMDCEHSSCMGAHLCVDQEDRVFFCTKKKEGSDMYSLRAPSRELYNEIYWSFLQSVNMRRKNCKAECSSFCFCQGECVMKEKTDDVCTEYLEKVKVVQKCMAEYGDRLFVEMENPLLWQMVLSLTAYGFSFESTVG